MWKPGYGEGEETARIIYLLFWGPGPREPGGNCEQQHCPLSAKQGTMRLPPSQVKAGLRDTDIFHLKKNDTN